jgi:hypothetical protein
MRGFWSTVSDLPQPGSQRHRAGGTQDIELISDKGVVPQQIQVGVRRGVDEQDAERDAVAPSSWREEVVVPDHVPRHGGGSPEADHHAELNLVIRRSAAPQRISSYDASGAQSVARDAIETVVVECAAPHIEVGRATTRFRRTPQLSSGRRF